MSTGSPPSEYFPKINFNYTFWSSGKDFVTKDYVDQNFLKAVGYAYSRAISTSFSGIIYALGGIETTTIKASGDISANTFTGSGASLTSLNASNISSGTLTVARGGTGASTFGVKQLLIGNGTNPITTTPNLVYDISTNTLIPINIAANGSGLTNLNVSNASTGTLVVTRGGTGATNFTFDRILLGNGTNPITENGNLTWNTSTNTLTVTGTATASAMSATSMGTNSLSVTATATITTVNATNISGNGSGLTNLNASNVSSGVLTVANGGTGQSTFGMNRILYGAGGNGAIATLADLTFDGSTLTCYGEFATYKGLTWINNQNSKLSRVLVANQFSTGAAIGDIVLVSDAKLHLVGGSTGTQAPALTVDAVNNIGIGKTNPSATSKLDIVGTTTMTNTTALNLDIVKTSTTAGDLLNMRYDQNNGLRYAQSYIGANDVKYNVIAKNNNVDTNMLTYYKGNIGIGTTVPLVETNTTRLHIYNAVSSRILLDTTTTGTAAIEFRRGTGFDIQQDFRFINDTDSTLKLQYENNQQAYADSVAQLMWVLPNVTSGLLSVKNWKNTEYVGNVGIGKTFSTTNKLDVLGDVNIEGKTTYKGNIECLTLNPATPTIPTALTIIPTPTSTFTPASTITRCAILTYQGSGTGTTYSVNIPAGGMLCDILMVGGGGSGGRDIGAGGGGGAVLYATNVLLKQDTYMVTVGRGAVFGSGEARGQSTTGFGATLVGGGSAGDTVWNNATYANDGGSGAGGKSVPDEWSKRGGRPIVGGSRKGGLLTDGTLYEGNVGGYGVVQNNQVVSSGGGGAGAVGGNGQTTGAAGGLATGSSGGDGVSNTILDTNFFWGGGGGGGSYNYTTPANGGKGGGGAGQNQGGTAGAFGNNGVSSFFAVGSGNNVINGINGTGGGGGGVGYQNTTAGSGGAGVIIIRYKLPTNQNQTITYLPTGTNGTITYKEGMIGANYKIEASLSSIVVNAFEVDAITASTSIKNSGLVVKSATNDTLITNNCGIGIDPSSAYRLNVNGDLNVNGTIWNNGFSVNAGFQQYRTFNFTYTGDTNFLLTTRARYCNIICWVSSGSGVIVSNGANMAVNEFRGSLGFSMTQSNATSYFFYWTMQGDTPRPFKAWFGNGSNTTFTFIEMWYN